METCRLPALALERRMSSLWFAILAIAFVAAWAMYLTSPAPPFPNAAGAGLVILPLATNGLIGLVMGLWLSRHAEMRRMLEPRVVGSAFVGLLVLLVSLAPTPLVQMTVGTVLRFGAIVALAIICGTGARRPMVRLISQLGRYSLSVFILHRPVIQAIQFLISRAELSASLRYACLYPVTLGCMLLLCAARDRDDRVDRMLRAVRL